MRTVLGVLVFSLVLVSGGQVFGAMYSGSLSSATGGLDGLGEWVDPGPSTIEWSVDRNIDGSWHYAYTLSVGNKGEVSHIIIEASPTFEPSDIFNDSGPYESIIINTHIGPGPGQPDMPSDIYGIKFDDTYGLTVHIEFDAWRMPVWGDFYAKDGGNDPVRQVWNTGFGSVDVDPTDPPSNGSIDNHILVPDTYVPEPATLGSLAIGGLAVIRRRYS